MSKENRILIIRGVSSALLLALAYFLPLDNILWLRITLYVLSYLVAGYDVIIESFKNIFKDFKSLCNIFNL